MKQTLSCPKKLIFVLAVLLLLFVLALALFFYFGGNGAYGGAYRKNDFGFSLYDREKTCYLSPEGTKEIPKDKALYLENKEKESLSFTFYQKGEEKGSITLPGKTAKKLNFPLLEGDVSLLVRRGEKEVAYLSDRASFLALSRKMEKGGDLTFFSSVSLGKVTLSAPFRLFGDFTFDELSLETKREGKIVFSPEREFSATFFISAPHCSLNFENIKSSYEKEAFSFCFQTKSVNGKKLAKNHFPVSSFEDLERLSDKSLLPRLTDGAKVHFVKGFSLKESLFFENPVSLHFEKEVEFGENTLSFATAKHGAFHVKTAPGVKLYSPDLIFSAPLCTLTWEGDAVPSLSIIEKQNNLSSYNGKALSLGGEGKAVPTLLLSAEKNPLLEKDVLFSLSGNTLVGIFPYSVSREDLKNMVFDLSCEKGSAYLEGDLSDGVITALDHEGKEKRFGIEIGREKKKIPVVMIETDEGKEIESKTQYVTASFKMDGVAGIPSQKETGIRIRGRGNSTWKWDKKPYKIHFDTPTSLLGLPEAEEWALFANYADKSLMRNRLAQEMAGVLSFDYCPSQVYVDLFVNGEYLGVYTLGEHLEAGEGRVEVTYNPKKTDCGFFLEAGGVTSGVDVKGLNYFHADLVKFVLIKSPDYLTLTSEQFNFIKNYMLRANDAVKKGEGYEEYLDMDTLVDWMIMTELSCNTDCSWRRSTYFTKNPGEKLKMGPVWDFDLAFGNFSKDNDGYNTFVSTEPEDDYVGETWSTHLLEDPEFRALFKARWQEKSRELLKVAFDMIEEDYEVLFPSAEENFSKWQILGKKVAFERHDTTLYTTYESQIRYLKNFLMERAAWLDAKVENW